VACGHGAVCRDWRLSGPSLTPVFASGFAISPIDERLAWYHGIALALAVTGLLLVNRG
jgi:hypothetical protein